MSIGNYPPGMSQRDWSHVNGESFRDEDEEPLSACCDAEIIYGDICSECREHTEPRED